MKVKILVWFLMLGNSFAFGQMREYDYKREITGVSAQWHRLELPDDIFGKLSKNLSDLRIYGITDHDDTLEAPYVLRLMQEKISDKQVTFETINPSRNDAGYFFTFEIPTTEPINKINLEFRQQNFDWRIKLEGSYDQADWFTVADNYRILSIKNDQTDFRFTSLNFPTSKYRYFRIFIKSHEKPDLVKAAISLKEITEGSYRNYQIRKSETKVNSQTRQTEIDIELQSAVPVSKIRISVTDRFDYYRPITIKYLADSFKTEQDWKYTYHTLTSGILNSIEEKTFTCNSTTVRKLKIIMNNQDNQPLNVDNIEVMGYVHELATRFNQPATYFLTYGNSSAYKPQYDIARFTDKIPEVLTTLELGEELMIEKKLKPEKSPLFKNPAWLWAIMVLIILLLGWFTLKMLKNQ